MSKLSFCILCLLLFYLVAAANSSRKVSVSMNPGCNISKCNTTNTSPMIAYTRSQGKSDCLHYLWSIIQNSQPTLLLISSTDTNSTIHINWTNLLVNQSSIEGSVTLLAKKSNQSMQEFSSIYILHKLFQYNDTENSASITDKGNFNITSTLLNLLTWNVTIFQHSNSILFEGRGKQIGLDSKILLRFSTYTKSGQGLEFPHLTYNDHSSMLEVVLDNLTTLYAGSRFGLGILLVNPGNTSYKSNEISGLITQKIKMGIDDEYAPSVFTTEQLLFVSNKTESQCSFWQWRTVCYYTKKPSRKFSSDITTTKLHKNRTSDINVNPILLAYFGQSNVQSFIAENAIVLFGKVDDGFYRSVNYTSWTSVIGTGIPPSDSMSLLVKCVIFTSVGCPIIVIVTGAVILVVKRVLKHHETNVKFVSNYDPIT